MRPDPKRHKVNLPAAEHLAVPKYSLNTGGSIPAEGYGIGGQGQVTEEELYQCIRTALECGYRLFDSSLMYEYEKVLGRAIEDSQIQRSEIFLQSKFPPTYSRDPEKSLDITLKNLRTDYLDSFLAHWPIPMVPVDDDPAELGSEWDKSWSFVQTYNLMQQIPKEKVRAIGVCNFTKSRLQLLLAAPSTKVVPAILQIEGHPELPQDDLLAFAKEHNIVVQCFSPLAKGQVNNPVIREVARKHDVNSAQIALSWGVGRGTVVISKSFIHARIESNLELIKLDQEDYDKIAELGRTPRRIVNPKLWFEHDIFAEN